jgi:hypothetical protein
MTQLDHRVDAQSIEMSLWIGGSQYRVDIVGGTAAMADDTRWRLAELSGLWAPTGASPGDLGRLGATEAGSVSVAAETLLLLALAGRRAGASERSRDQGGRAPGAEGPEPDVHDGMTLDFAGLRVELDAPIPPALAASARSLVPALTADIVVADLAETGAWGGRLAVDGVVRAFGISADGATWRAGIQVPSGQHSVVEVGDGAVAVSRATVGADGDALSMATRRRRHDSVAWAAVAALTAWQAQVIANSIVGLGDEAVDAVSEQVDDGGALGAVVLRNDGRTVEYGIFT